MSAVLRLITPPPPARTDHTVLGSLTGFIGGEEIEQCRFCGTRTMFMEIKGGTEQIHYCPNLKCEAVYLMTFEDDAPEIEDDPEEWGVSER